MSGCFEVPNLCVLRYFLLIIDDGVDVDVDVCYIAFTYCYIASGWLGCFDPYGAVCLHLVDVILEITAPNSSSPLEVMLMLMVKALPCLVCLVR